MAAISQRTDLDTSSTETAPPLCQIRALYDDEFITIYQAYNDEIASQAVQHQKLDASPLFKPARMTWVKPSWCWMMYRSGYSYKDKNQTRILALRMKRDDFLKLLEKAVLTTEAVETVGPTQELKHTAVIVDAEGDYAISDVRVQWDPERSSRLVRQDYRSIQIGIRGTTRAQWIDNWIVDIQDVTDRARGLKSALQKSPEITDEELVERGFLPQEQPFAVPETLHRRLRMDRPAYAGSSFNHLRSSEDRFYRTELT